MGASGKKTCFCLAIHGRVEPEELDGDPFFSHVRTSETSKFHHCDPDAFKLQCQKLESTFQNGSISQGEKLEITYG